MRLRTVNVSPLSLFASFTGFFFCSTCRLCLARWNLDDVLFNELQSEECIDRREIGLLTLRTCNNAPSFSALFIVKNAL